ncbi:MAG TPA: PKD domain-containing protein, partial [Flavisolibacter sp.]|nr:PKD domain-containing protein [Flavisolibacter sp.]
MYYVLINQSGNNYTYKVTLKLFRDCNAPSGSADLDQSAAIAIFNNSNNTQFSNNIIPITSKTTQSLSSPGACIQNPPTVCYQVGYYEFTVTLPGTSEGYTISYQRCCRIIGINNLINSNSAGATYTAQIPGTIPVISGPINNSAKFIGKDTVIVCANNNFCYDFGANDPDSDSLTYAFTNAFTSQQNPPNPNPPANPPYTSVPYGSGFNAISPLGSGVTINPQTGLMCGVAPPVGIYVVTVSVTEWRNGVPIATQRKDLQIKIGDCNVAAARPAIFDVNGVKITPDIAGCKSFTYKFSNEVPHNPLIESYYWDFGDGNTSSAQTPSHTYSDTGVYHVKLVINRGQDCGDSSVSSLKVYPGFFPGFTSAGICMTKPTQFRDTSKTIFGTVNSWKWDFGVTTLISDTSRVQSPTYTYMQNGTYKVNFTVTTTKGCIETVQKDVQIIDKPPITLAFRDTLICDVDNLQLQASGNGIFSWTPVTNMINENTGTPTVSPKTTTKYYVRLDDNGCINTDSVRVRVISRVTLNAMADTTICATDPVQLRATTDGLRFQWMPSETINNPTALSPIARPTTTTTYRITARVGSCSATDDVTVTLVPYPGANAGLDTIICFNTAAQLNGSIVGSSFNWSPAGSLSNPNILNPIATPVSSTSYILSVFDNKGCPKPGRDTVLVTVLPKVNGFAGRDTAVIVGQPLQFNATGGTYYQWSPATSLSSSNISNPVGKYDGSFDSIRYSVVVMDESGCTDVAQVKVRIFKTNPTVFVPTAFTPNGDGRNDVLRPIPVG